MSDLVNHLARVSKIWLDPNHPLREETIQALQVSTGFSRRQIELALSHCFEALTEQTLAAFWASAPSKDGLPRNVLHILPSNVFTAWVHGVVITLLLGHRCLLKPSSREPIFARAWQKSLKEVDPALAETVRLVEWDEKWLRECQAVVAYGSDETLEKIRAKLPNDVLFVGYGHKLSVGVIFEEAFDGSSGDALLEATRRDAEPFRLQGCLSPQILYVQSPEFIRWPELEAHLDVAPKIKPFGEWAHVLQELSKFSPYLSCVGYAGSPDRGAFLERELRHHGVSRICPLGDMQKPPLSWANGGIHLSNLLHSAGGTRAG